MLNDEKLFTLGKDILPQLKLLDDHAAQVLANNEHKHKEKLYKFGSLKKNTEKYEHVKTFWEGYQLSLKNLSHSLSKLTNIL